MASVALDNTIKLTVATLNVMKRLLGYETVLCCQNITVNDTFRYTIINNVLDANDKVFN